MRYFNRKSRGFTLIELMVSLGIFGIVSVIIYSTFTTITATVSKVTEVNNLSDKGQRLLSFIEEDLRMIGYNLGPYARIPYCTGSAAAPSAYNVIVYTPGASVDSLTFLTSYPVKVKETAACMAPWTDCNGQVRTDYFLTTRQSVCAPPLSPLDGQMDNDKVSVHVAKSCFDDDIVALDPTPTQQKNGKSLVTFEVCRGTEADTVIDPVPLYYAIDTFGMNSGIQNLTLPVNTSPAYQLLKHTIPDNSTVFAIRQYRYDVVPAPLPASVPPTGGTLRRVGWDKDCLEVATNLLEASGASGGVDGLKFEFTSADMFVNPPVMTTSATLPVSFNDLRSVTVWLLIRSDRITQGYTNTDTYTLGTTAAKVTLGPYNDHYRRVLIHKSVGVKNLARTN